MEEAHSAATTILKQHVSVCLMCVCFVCDDGTLETAVVHGGVHYYCDSVFQGLSAFHRACD